MERTNASSKQRLVWFAGIRGYLGLLEDESPLPETIRLDQNYLLDAELVAYYDRMRLFQVHEDNLIDKRTNWPLVVQGALFAFGGAILGSPAFPVDYVEYKAWALAGIALIGMLVALATWMGVVGAALTQRAQARRYIHYAHTYLRRRIELGEALGMPDWFYRDDWYDHDDGKNRKKLLDCLPLPHVVGELGVRRKWGHWGNSFLGTLMPFVWLALLFSAWFIHSGLMEFKRSEKTRLANERAKLDKDLIAKPKGTTVHEWSVGGITYRVIERR